MVSVCTLSARKWDFYDFIYRLSKQTHKDIEWIFVDYFYEQNKKAIKKFSSNFGLRITHIQNETNTKYARNIAYNRNKALVYAKGDIILFTDDYVVIDPDFIKNHSLCVTNDKTVSCGRMYYMTQECKYLLRSVESLLAFSHKDDDRFILLGKPSIVTMVLGNEWTYTGNLCVPLSLFIKTNGFDPRLSARGEDCDFGLRAGKLGATILYNPFATSINLCTKNFPIKANVCEHAFSNLSLFKTTGDDAAMFYSRSSTDLIHIVKYDCNVAVCAVCGAEYILNPHKFVYDKLERGEFVVPKELFNLEEERICVS